MKSVKSSNGSVVLEVIISTALSSIFFLAIGGMIVAANNSSQFAKTATRALWMAEESLSVLRISDFSTLSSGTYVMTYNAVSFSWDLVTGASQTIDGFTRVLTIEDAYRDEDCQLVDSGGSVDEDTKYITSAVSWVTLRGATRTIEAESLLVDWKNPSGSCLVPTEAGAVTIDTGSAYWGGSKQLRDVFISNGTSEGVTVTSIVMTWDAIGSELQQMFIGSGKVWSSTGPGLPLGTQPSGVEIDILDFEVASGTSGEAYKVQFTGAMSGATVTMTFKFSDGSELTTEPFTP